MPGAARRAGKVLVLLLFVAYEMFAYFVLRDSLGVQVVSGLTHAVCYLIMLWYFGGSLRAGREPLVTRLARSVHGTLAPGTARFTRRVTVAWAVFFVAQVLVSAWLFALAPLDAWSLFINVLNVPLVLLMFFADYVARVVHYRGRPPVPITRILRAFAEVASDPEGTKAH